MRLAERALQLRKCLAANSGFVVKLWMPLETLLILKISFGGRRETTSNKISAPAWIFEKASVSSTLVIEFSLSLAILDDCFSLLLLLAFGLNLPMFVLLQEFNRSFFTVEEERELIEGEKQKCRGKYIGCLGG